MIDQLRTYIHDLFDRIYDGISVLRHLSLKNLQNS